MTRVVAYLRTSSPDGEPGNQRHAIAELANTRGWEPVYRVDRGWSGADERRPAFQQLLEECRGGRWDVVVVAKLDRLSRSLSHLVLTMDELRASGVDVVTCDGKLDTTTASGRLQWQILAVVAEFERELVSERIQAAYQRKKAAGEDDWGRPRAQVPEWLLEGVDTGELSVKDAAEKAGVSRATIYRRLEEVG